MRFLFILSVLFSAVSLQVSAQSIALSGKILDQSGEGLIGATVQVKGETTGTVTDLDGAFRLSVAQGQTIVISMIGMESEEYLVKSSRPITIQLKEATAVLGEVVITGFQEVDRKLFTGASESLQMDDIKVNGLTDVSRALEGQVAGVNVDNVSGTFGTSPKIRIRGNASINGNNQPLFVIDGVILEDLANVNTDDFISGNANTLISSSILEDFR